jgi:DNA repair protein RecO (recombination protein O)
MSLISDEAFILRSLKFSESDRIVTFYSKSSGKIKGVAKGASKSRKRFGGTLEPLTEVRVTYFEKEGRELARIDHCDLIASHVAIQKQLKYYYALSYIAEITDLFSRVNEKDEKFYRLIKAIVKSLEEGVTLAICIRYFEIWTLKLQGLLPSLTHCSHCGAEIEKKGGIFFQQSHDFVCSDCSKRYEQNLMKLNKETLSFIIAVLKKNVKEIKKSALFEKSVNETLEKFLSALFLSFIEKPFLSYKYLKEWMVP